MNHTVFIKNLNIHGCCGCEDREKINPQLFIFNVELITDFSRVFRSDDLKDTVDYRDTEIIIRNIFQKHVFSTIERLGQKIIDEIFLQNKCIRSITIIIDKPAAPVNFVCDSVGIKIHETRLSYNSTS